jgi:hypothetical protein
MRRVALVVAAWLIAVLPLLALPRPAAAAAYALSTRATYTLQPDARRIDVGVAATLKNTTPNPPGQFSVFDELKLAVQDGASAVSARDASGALTAKLARENGVNVITVALRAGIRYGKHADVTVGYQLADGAAEGLRVRPSAVVFPAWGFGTAGQVTVAVPPGYEVQTDGDAVTAATTSDGTTLSSGPIADPTRWLVMVVATHATTYRQTDRQVPLEGGTMDLQVRSFDDDAAWGTTTADLLAQAMPRLQEAIGLPYARQGPVVVTESVDAASGGIGEGSGTSPELLVAFDQPAFTVVHQAAHLWLTPQLAGDRWIREGLASWAAAQVAGDLRLAPPYDPAARTAALAAAAFPLASWGAGSATEQQDAYAYAASWDLAASLANAIGADAMRTALRRIAAGRSAYDPVEVETPPPGAVTARAVDSRQLLDHLQAVSSADIVSRYVATVFGPDVADEITARGAARDAYAALLVRAGDWGGPAPVTSALAAWDFPTATSAITAADTWLADRDALLATIGEAGLTTPSRLRESWTRDGGGPEAVTELEAERAVADAYRAALVRSVGERSFIERIGLLAGPDPAAILVHANGAFAEGDLQVALDDARRADQLVAGARTQGTVRLVSAAEVLVAGFALAIWLIRRRGLPHG